MVALFFSKNISNLLPYRWNLDLYSFFRWKTTLKISFLYWAILKSSKDFGIFILGLWDKTAFISKTSLYLLLLFKLNLFISLSFKGLSKTNSILFSTIDMLFKFAKYLLFLAILSIFICFYLFLSVFIQQIKVLSIFIRQIKVLSVFIQ